MRTKAHFVFPDAFLSLGGRCAPFDEESDRISGEPLLVGQNINEVADGVFGHNETVFLVSFGREFQDASGIVFDFMLPAVETMLTLGSQNRRRLWSGIHARWFFLNLARSCLMNVTGK